MENTAAANSSETPDIRPSAISEMDRLQLLVLTERKGRLQAQLAAMQGQYTQAQQELKKAQDETYAIGERFRTEYLLTQEDQLDLETGKITRGK